MADWLLMPYRRDSNTIRIILLIFFLQCWTKPGPEMSTSKCRRLWSCIWTIQCVVTEQRSLRKCRWTDWGEHSIQHIHQISAPVTSGHSKQLRNNQRSTLRGSWINSQSDSGNMKSLRFRIFLKCLHYLDGVIHLGDCKQCEALALKKPLEKWFNLRILR
jgi:hypothetical protein